MSKIKRKIELTQVVFEATYRCNSRCSFCYNCWKDGYIPQPEMELDNIKKIFSGLPPTERIAISGGEPLLRDDLEDIIKEAKAKSKHVAVLTNGTLIDDEKARMFKKYDIRVQVPFHGMEETHNRIVGRKDGYKEAIMGIAYLKKHGVSFAVSSVVNKQNISEFAQVIELAVALGAREFMAIRFMPGGAGLKETDLMLSDLQYVEMLRILNKDCKKYGIFGAIGAPNIPCRFPEGKYKHIQFSGCSAGIDWVALDPSGRVRLCNHSPTILGDLNIQDFEEIWENPILRSVRNIELAPDGCKDCKELEICRGGCRAVAETLCGSLKGNDPLMEKR